MKIVSWNVNGIRASWSHGLSAFLDECKADIYAFQETKTDEAIPMISLEGITHIGLSVPEGKDIPVHCALRDRSL